MAGPLGPTTPDDPAPGSTHPGPPDPAPATGDDPGLRRVLDHLGVRPSALLGQGGEARCYALDDERVVRVLHGPAPPGAEAEATAREALVDELRRSPAPFLLPKLLEVGRLGDRVHIIERRLPGVDVGRRLAECAEEDRRPLVEAHLETAARLGDLALEPRGWFGDLLARPAVRASTWPRYLETAASRSLARAPGFGAVDPVALARGLPPCRDQAFVDLDAFVGNMLAVGTTVTAVIDIGGATVVGDRRLNDLAAVVYLCAPAITPTATETDRATGRRWLADRGLDRWYEPARRWLAAYWAWAVDDEALHRWCREVLL